MTRRSIGCTYSQIPRDIKLELTSSPLSIPGIPPTGKSVRVPMTSVINLRGDRLCHEHIAWDQASLLSQLGLIPVFLPFPYELPGGIKPAPGKRFEYQVPVAGLETAQKLISEASVASNGMFAYKVREVDDV